MKQPLFRVFDLQLRRYLTKEDKVSIGLDGSISVPKKKGEKAEPPAEPGETPIERYSLAENTGIPDVKGKELYSDDHIVMIIDNKAQICHVKFDVVSRSWMASPGGDAKYPITEFEIGPSLEEVEAVYKNPDGPNPGVLIMAEWEQKAKDMENEPPAAQVEPEKQPEPEVKPAEEPKADPQPEPEESAKNEAEQPAKTIAILISARRLQNVETEAAPIWWRKNADIVAARPRQAGVEILLKRLTGTNIAVWYIKRNENWNAASDMFLVIEKEVAEPQPQEEVATTDENTGTE